jgi:hypothetical protein
MKKILIALLFIPFMGFSQVDISRHHNESDLWELVDSNFADMFSDIISNQTNILSIVTDISSAQAQILNLEVLFDSTFVEATIDTLYVNYKLVVPKYASHPPNPVLGMIYYNTTNNDLWLWDGDWEILDGN